MAAHNELGEWGEEKAAQYLSRGGYTICQRDWKSGKRDLDIVALTPDGTTLVFVEVKTRASDELESPQDAVTRKKMASVGCAANDYIKSFAVEDEVRFDVISVVGTNDSDIRIEHIEDAFNPLLL